MKTSHPPEEELSALVDGELTARRRRQVSAHVGAGLFLIVAALLINLTISTPLTGVQLLARAHDANSNLPFYSPTEGYHAVGTGDDAQSWRLVRHVWIRLGKDFVEQTVYQVGYCPVSEFTGLPDAFFPTRMIQANRWGYTFYLAWMIPTAASWHGATARNGRLSLPALPPGISCNWPPSAPPPSPWTETKEGQPLARAEYFCARSYRAQSIY